MNQSVCSNNFYGSFVLNEKSNDDMNKFVPLRTKQTQTMKRLVPIVQNA